MIATYQHIWEKQKQRKEMEKKPHSGKARGSSEARSSQARLSAGFFISAKRQRFPAAHFLAEWSFSPLACD